MNLVTVGFQFGVALQLLHSDKLQLTGHPA